MGNVISLVGPRAVGKSTIGKELSVISKYDFINLDKVMQKKLKPQGGIIGYANKNSWNKYFGLVNAKLKKIFVKYKHKDLILDLGGGITASIYRESKVNATFVKKNSIIILILPSKIKKESLNVLFLREHLRRKAGMYPWSKNWSKKRFNKEMVTDHYSQRVPIFKEHANHIVYTKYRSPKQVARNILKLIN